jgi:hypothetical protein
MCHLLLINKETQRLLMPKLFSYFFKRLGLSPDSVKRCSRCHQDPASVKSSKPCPEISWPSRTSLGDSAQNPEATECRDKQSRRRKWSRRNVGQCSCWVRWWWKSSLLTTKKIINLRFFFSVKLGHFRELEKMFAFIEQFCLEKRE